MHLYWFPNFGFAYGMLIILLLLISLFLAFLLISWFLSIILTNQTRLRTGPHEEGERR